jgi:hypothetical protein
MKLEFSQDIFLKNTYAKFHENPSSGRYGPTDMTKLVVAFRNFANAPEKKKDHPTQCRDAAHGPGTFPKQNFENAIKRYFKKRLPVCKTHRAS